MRKKRFFKKLLIIFWILLSILILLVLINFKTWKYFEKKEVKLIPIVDRCSVMFDNVLHSIKDESSCENYCRAECTTRKMEFYNTEFSLNGASCNICNCYCK